MINLFLIFIKKSYLEKKNKRTKISKQNQFDALRWYQGQKFFSFDNTINFSLDFLKSEFIDIDNCLYIENFSQGEANLLSYEPQSKSMFSSLNFWNFLTFLKEKTNYLIFQSYSNFLTKIKEKFYLMLFELKENLCFPIQKIIISKLLKRI